MTTYTARNTSQDQPSILVVDDEQSLLDAITYSFRREGWNVDTATNGTVAIQKVTDQNPDLVVLDVMLPGVSGIQVCRSVRSTSSVPIIFLSARSEDVDRILGLEIGGDDYLTKPFVMRELVARVRAILRRSDSAQTHADPGDIGSEQSATKRREVSARSDALKIDHVELDLPGRTVRIRGETVDLKPKEFDLLSYLMLHAGVAISRETLLREVWNYSFSVDTRTIDVHIRGLRQKIEDDPSNPVLLTTVRGHGYRFRSNP